jgi:hypothetical protein
MERETSFERSAGEHIRPVSFAAYGRTIRVHVDDPDILAVLPKFLPYGAKRSRARGADRVYSLFTRVRERQSLFHGSECLAESHELHEILDVLERDARLYVSEHARREVFVHAGVLGWRGRAILIPGKSMSGKTTLTAEFVRAGATYYSDEFAVLDEQGRVHPYAKPLSIRNRDGYSQTDSAVESLGGRAGREALPVGMVLLTEYRAGAHWRPRNISAGMGALGLLANTVAARTQPEKTLHVLRNAMCTASVLKSVRGEATDVVGSVLG